MNEPSQAPATAAVTLPEDALAILPLRHTVLFPGVILPLAIGREGSIAAAQYAVQHEMPVGVLMQTHPEPDSPGKEDLAEIGTVASILRYISTPDGTHHVVCQGEQRFRVIELLPGLPFVAARVERIEEPAGTGDKEIEARLLQLRARAVEVLGLMPQAAPEMIQAISAIDSPSALADIVAGYLDIKPMEKQQLLELQDLRERLDRLLQLVVHQLQVMQISRDIEQRTKASIGSREREYVLREQMKAIQKELGDNTGSSIELEALRSQIAAASMPQEVARHVERELARLERMSDASAEYSMLRSYLDWLAELPWKTPEPDAIDLQHARAVLDADHFGLDKVKQRILEFLAVRKLNPLGQGPILCFAGPPGIGKTSLGQSIARAMGRPFVRVSLGGVHDEAELRGHRRTYVGALPGNIIQAMKKAGARNCVMMLDEIDKVGAGVHGDPSAALLEILDPQQNRQFRDNYLALPYDLSQVLFIATANILDPIPAPLRDRMEVIQLSGYTVEEKREIARRYLLPRQLADCGLPAGQLEITDAALTAIVRHYTREAGVRHLERQIGAVCRHAAVQVAQGETASLRVDESMLDAILGPGRFENELALRAGMPGVAAGLAWTAFGGEILFVEASKTRGSGRLILTGQLGDVMKESAQAALTLVKSRSDSMGIDPAQFEKTDVHIHVPAGAIPKDGPSAGVAMFIALASLFLELPVRSDVAMTGEISLRGLVMPVGGIKEKILAAAAAGIRCVLLPARNRRDIDEVPESVRRELSFVYLDDVDLARKTAVAPSAMPMNLEISDGRRTRKENPRTAG